MHTIEVPYLFKVLTKCSNIYCFSFFPLHNLKSNRIVRVMSKLKGYPQPVVRYIYEMNNAIRIPDSFDAIYRWFLLNDGIIYYERPLFANISLKFKYDIKRRKMSVCPLYHYLIRFEVGNIWPPGKILANFISYDFHKRQFGTFHGIALKYNESVVCIFAPGGNFKTPLLKFLLNCGGEYIGGDKLMIKEGEIYFLPTDDISPNYQRVSEYKHKITHIVFLQRSKKSLCKELKNRHIINSYLSVFRMINFLGTGWALNFRLMLDSYISVTDWYHFLKLKGIKRFVLLKGSSFDELSTTITKIIK